MTWKVLTMIPKVCGWFCIANAVYMLTLCINESAAMPITAFVALAGLDFVVAEWIGDDKAKEIGEESKSDKVEEGS